MRSQIKAAAILVFSACKVCSFLIYNQFIKTLWSKIMVCSKKQTSVRTLQCSGALIV